MQCDKHQDKPCGCQQYFHGKPVWSSEKGFSSSTLSATLFTTPYLLSTETLSTLIKSMTQANDNAPAIRTILMALGHFLNTFPMPFWLYDLPGMD